MSSNPPGTAAPSHNDRKTTVRNPSPAFIVRVANPTWHTLKVVPPYFEPVYEGSKTFEVRKNDRAYQRGDMLRLREYDPALCTRGCKGRDKSCPAWTGRECVRRVTFVYSGDPRFGGVEAGYVVLALTNDAEDDQ